MLDNIPLGPADFLAELEQPRPVHVPLADQRLVVRRRVFLQVDGGGAAGVALHVWDRVPAAVEGVAEVELHHHLRAGVAEEGVPRQLAFHRLELDAMVVVADFHAVRGRSLRCLVHQPCRLQPRGAGAALLRRKARYDEVLIAERLVELDRAGQLVAQDGVPARVCTAALQAAVIQELPQLLGAAAIVAGKLYPLIPHPGHGIQHAGQVVLTVLADRVKLQTDRYPGHCFPFSSGRRLRASSAGGRGCICVSCTLRPGGVGRGGARFLLFADDGGRPGLDKGGAFALSGRLRK